MKLILMDQLIVKIFRLHLIQLEGKQITYQDLMDNKEIMTLFTKHHLYVIPCDHTIKCK